MLNKAWQILPNSKSNNNNKMLDKINNEVRKYGK